MRTPRTLGCVSRCSELPTVNRLMKKDHFPENTLNTRNTEIYKNWPRSVPSKSSVDPFNPGNHRYFHREYGQRYDRGVFCRVPERLPSVTSFRYYRGSIDHVRQEQRR